MKLRFTEQESARVLNRVTWNVYVEVVVDGDVVVSTPHHDADELISNLVVCTSRTEDTSPGALTPHIEVIEVLHQDDRVVLDSRSEIRLVMWGVVDGDASKVVEWRGFLCPLDHQVQSFDVLDETTCSLPLSVNGYATAAALYTRSTPRRLKGLKISMNAVGVQRALDEFIL